MGCPYKAKLIFGIKLKKAEAKKIDDALEMAGDALEDNQDWDEEIGEFEPHIQSDENDKNFFLEIVEAASVDNCSFVTSVENSQDSFDEALKIFDNSPFLKKHFKRAQIELLLVCEYVG